MDTKYVPFPPFIFVLEKKHFLNIEPFMAGVILGILTVTAFHHQLQLISIFILDIMVAILTAIRAKLFSFLEAENCKWACVICIEN